MTTDEYKDHTPVEIASMVHRIMDRKTGYKISEQEQINTFSDKQEEKIRRAKEARLKTKG